MKQLITKLSGWLLIAVGFLIPPSHADAGKMVFFYSTNKVPQIYTWNPETNGSWEDGGNPMEKIEGTNMYVYYSSTDFSNCIFHQGATHLLEPTPKNMQCYEEGKIDGWSWTDSNSKNECQANALYLIGANIDGIENWNLTQSKAFSKNGNVYTLENVKFNNDAVFTLISHKPNANDWATVNIFNRYGAASVNQKLNVGENNVTKYEHDNNASDAKNWTIDAGTYDITVNLSTNKITITKVGGGGGGAEPEFYIFGNGIVNGNPNNWTTSDVSKMIKIEKGADGAYTADFTTSGYGNFRIYDGANKKEYQPASWTLVTTGQEYTLSGTGSSNCWHMHAADNSEGDYTITITVGADGTPSFTVTETNVESKLTYYFNYGDDNNWDQLEIPVVDGKPTFSMDGLQGKSFSIYVNDTKRVKNGHYSCANSTDTSIEPYNEETFPLVKIPTGSTGKDITFPANLTGQYSLTVNLNSEELPESVTIISPAKIDSDTYTIYFYYTGNDNLTDVKAYILDSSKNELTGTWAASAAMSPTGQYILKNGKYYPVWKYEFETEATPAYVFIHSGNNHLGGTTPNGDGKAFKNGGFYFSGGLDSKTYELVDKEIEMVNAPERLFLKSNYAKNWSDKKAYELTKNNDGTFSVMVSCYKGTSNDFLYFSFFSMKEDGTVTHKDDDKEEYTVKKYSIDKYYNANSFNESIGFGNKKSTSATSSEGNHWILNDNSYYGSVEIVVDFSENTPQVSVKKGASRYYLACDMNQWFSNRFVNKSNYFANGELTYNEGETTNANGDAMDRNLLWQTKEKWQLTPTEYNGESGWYKIELPLLAGQFQIFDGNHWTSEGTYSHTTHVDWDTNKFEDYWTSPLKVDGTENATKHGQGSNLHLPCNAMLNATVYFNPSKNNGQGAIAITGEKQNYFAFYDRSGDRKHPQLRAHINSTKPNANNYYIPFNSKEDGSNMMPGIGDAYDNSKTDNPNNHMNNTSSKEWNDNGYTMLSVNGLAQMTKAELEEKFPNAPLVVNSILKNKTLPNGVSVVGRTIWYAKIPNGFEYPAGTKFSLAFRNSNDVHSYTDDAMTEPHWTAIGCEHLYFFDGIHMHVNTEDIDKIANVDVYYRIYSYNSNYETVVLHATNDKSTKKIANRGAQPSASANGSLNDLTDGWVKLDPEHVSHSNWGIEYDIKNRNMWRIKEHEESTSAGKRKMVPAGLSSSYVQFCFVYSPKESQSSQRKAAWQPYSVYVPALPTMEQDDNEERLQGVDHYYVLDLNSDVATGIEDILDWEDEDFDGEVEGENATPVYYNLQGVRVANPTKGLYIKVTGSKSEKVMF